MRYDQEFWRSVRSAFRETWAGEVACGHEARRMDAGLVVNVVMTDLASVAHDDITIDHAGLPGNAIGSSEVWQSCRTVLRSSKRSYTTLRFSICE
jgi:hypothetical protein